MQLVNFAPYAFHCTRTFLLLLAGTQHRLFTDRSSNRIDIEYLFYAPFCEVFVSRDRLHRQLAPMVLKSGQRFVWSDDFKAELARLVQERKAKEESTTVPGGRPASGDGNER